VSEHLFASTVDSLARVSRRRAPLLRSAENTCLCRSEFRVSASPHCTRFARHHFFCVGEGGSPARCHLLALALIILIPFRLLLLFFEVVLLPPRRRIGHRTEHRSRDDVGQRDSLPITTVRGFFNLSSRTRMVTCRWNRGSLGGEDRPREPTRVLHTAVAPCWFLPDSYISWLSTLMPCVSRASRKREEKIVSHNTSVPEERIP